MLGSLPIGRVAGIPLRVHPLFLLLVLVLVLAPGAGPLTAVGLALLALVLVLHELGHALVARRFGIRVVDITLWPLGGMARLAQVPESSRVEALVAIAGPAVNLALAILGAAAWLGAIALFGPEALGTQIALWFVLINAIMGTFNLIPAFPTDGGRLLRAWLARSRSWLDATAGAVRVGRIVAVAIGIAGVALGQWMLPVIALWLWWTSGLELAQVRARHAWALAHADPRPGFAPDDIARLERFRGRLGQFDGRR